MVTFGSELLAAAVAGTEPGEQPLRHIAELPPQPGRPQRWPAWAEPDVIRAFTDRGISSPWSHQFAAAELAHARRHVVVSTGTASGKSLAYQLPILTALATDPRARVLYLSPTKALGHDQLRAAHALTTAIPRLHDVAPTAYDGDSPAEVRRFARERSRWLFSNPDMIHLSILRNHARWAVFLRGLRFLVVDECHYYRGVFGSNVAMVLRRLLRLCTRYSADPALQPTVIFASATTASPAATAAELIGQPVEEITEDGSPHGARTVALWEPALRGDLIGENGAPVRRSAGAEAARVMADLIAEGARTLTFVRSRRGAELTALGARARLDDIAPELAQQVASYRAGYLAEDRRALEQAVAEGRLRGLAATNALELGVDIAGLDAVVMAGFPGTVSSFWQQAGRSGRRGQGALIVLIARDDPLDTYLVHHPAALLDKPIERVVIDPGNPYILGPQLLCAATEMPLDDAEVRTLGAEEVAATLVDDGLLRRRSGRYFPTPGLDPHGAVDVRGPTGGQVVIVETETGRLLGTAGAGQAPASVHPGAVYLHQGDSYVVDSLEDGIAFVHAEDPGYATFARELTDIAVSGPGERAMFGPVTLGLVPVTVTSRVVGYLRRRLTGETIDFVELEMPAHSLATTAVMYTVTPEALGRNGIDVPRIPGSLHAAEHAAIGLLPLVASCDRGDIGGLSSAVGPDPLAPLPSVFVYDGYPGGAGFAERGFRQAGIWLAATAAAIEACECPRGCPSCVQSPKCGSGNEPLDKAGAVRVLRLVVDELRNNSW